MSDDPNPEQPRDPFAEAFKAASKPYEWPDPRPNEVFASALWHEIKRRCGLALRWISSIPQMVRRVRVIARVQMVAQEVSDADDLYSRIFPLPPKSPDHEAMRRAWVAITLQPNKSRSEVLQFADWLDGLEKDYGDDPLYALRHAKPAKIIAAPAEATPQALGFFGPVGAVASGIGGKLSFYVSCILGAMAIVFLLHGMTLGAKLNAVRAERDAAVRDAQATAQERDNWRTAAEQERSQYKDATLRAEKDAEEARKVADEKAARSARARARERKRYEDALSGGAPNWDRRLSDLEAAALFSGNSGSAPGGNAASGLPDGPAADAAIPAPESAPGGEARPVEPRRLEGDGGALGEPSAPR